MSVSVAIKNATETIGEGPHWDSQSKTLLFVDILKGNVLRFDPNGGNTTKVHVGGNVGFVIPRNSGGYVIGHNRTLSSFHWQENEATNLEIFHEVDVGTKNRFNDGKCDSTGRLWAGTMGYEEVPANPELRMASLYMLDTNLKLSKKVSPVDISNGLAWSLDNKTMYYIDSIPRKVFAFDYDVSSGNIDNQRVAIDFGSPETIPTLGYPDGMCIDQEGCLWVACYGLGKVVRFDPTNGKQLTSIEFPCRATTSCCFGGENLEELYVTSACQAMSEEDWKNYPLSGSLFCVKGLGAKGFPGHNFAG